MFPTFIRVSLIFFLPHTGQASCFFGFEICSFVCPVSGERLVHAGSGAVPRVSASFTRSDFLGNCSVSLKQSESESLGFQMSSRGNTVT